MLLIDALYINDGGGKTMLDYLISKLEEQNIDCFYLLDDRIKNDLYQIKSSNKIIFVRASLWNRYLFYIKNKNSFKTVFCLANIPPNIKMNCNSITYFHSTLYIDLSTDNSFVDKIKIKLKRFILKKFLKNSDYWFVQTDLIKKSFNIKFNVDKNITLVKPFYPPMGKSNDIFKKEAFVYLYVSIATAHKNHKRLIESFCEFYDKHDKGKLRITVGQEFVEVLKLVESKIKLGYPIENLGYIERDELLKYYQTSEYFVFPSLTESFGLGLIEAIENGCKIIGADLPYTYAVCKPSIVFDPYSVESIVSAFEATLENNIGESKSLIKDMINDVTNFIK
ncbi:Glycosyltransferase involved in cell wall bisynthesis [Flavobacterium segetis]|uniref:Glycosyltransferase involved in cell wall bisynthesis n=1 Tax=Flavobacterium segetis TaxID=271157 RepID=A0A1M5IF81_9FLAO|nr:glycosyltransferase [Flavobacterium segetis]SHG27054.1 Glycosyltransferase involved in cell wall bisynthesis [Flavobacterium segetis]